MSTTTTWPGGATDATPTAYTIPASGELNWAALSNFLNVLATSAQSTTAQKWAVRKALTSPVTVSATADCVVVTQLTSPGAVTVNLPAGANKQVFSIVDGTGDAGTNNVTINRNGSDTIAGATSLVMSTNREAVILCYNSSDTDWKIVSRTNGSGSPATVPSAGIVSSSGTALTSGGNSTGNGTISSTATSASLPTYSFVGDTNTGMYRSAADELSLATGGSQRVVVDSSGQVGIGAATPHAKLEISGSAASNLKQLRLNNDGVVGSDQGSGIDFYSTATNQSGYIYVLNSSSSDYMSFGTRTSGTTASEKMRLTAAGLLDLSSGAGVKFPSGSSTLAWYEEGTFTPTIAGTSTAGTVTYTTQVGAFTRIGRNVSFSMQVAWSDWTGSPAGSFRISGLPYAQKNTSGLGPVYSMIVNNITLPASGLWISALGNSGQTHMDLYASKTGAAPTLVDPATNSGAANRQLFISGSYAV